MYVIVACVSITKLTQGFSQSAAVTTINPELVPITLVLTRIHVLQCPRPIHFAGKPILAQAVRRLFTRTTKFPFVRPAGAGGGGVSTSCYPELNDLGLTTEFIAQ